jgi:hypothetical protein
MPGLIEVVPVLGGNYAIVIKEGDLLGYLKIDPPGIVNDSEKAHKFNRSEAKRFISNNNKLIQNLWDRSKTNLV